MKIEKIKEWFKEDMNAVFSCILIVSIVIVTYSTMVGRSVKRDLQKEMDKKIEIIQVQFQDQFNIITQRIKKIEFDMPMEPQDINFKLDDLAHRIMTHHAEDGIIKWSLPYYDPKLFAKEADTNVVEKTQGD